MDQLDTSSFDFFSEGFGYFVGIMQQPEMVLSTTIIIAILIVMVLFFVVGLVVNLLKRPV